MASLAESVAQPILLEAVRSRTRRECRLLSRAVMRVPFGARILIAVGLGLLTIVSLYLN